MFKNKTEVTNYLFTEYFQAYQNIKPGEYIPKWFSDEQLNWIFKLLNSKQMINNNFKIVDEYFISGMTSSNVFTLYPKIVNNKLRFNLVFTAYCVIINQERAYKHDDILFKYEFIKYHLSKSQIKEMLINYDAAINFEAFIIKQFPEYKKILNIMLKKAEHKLDINNKPKEIIKIEDYVKQNWKDEIRLKELEYKECFYLMSEDYGSTKIHSHDYYNDKPVIFCKYGSAIHIKHLAEDKETANFYIELRTDKYTYRKFYNTEEEMMNEIYYFRRTQYIHDLFDIEDNNFKHHG